MTEREQLFEAGGLFTKKYEPSPPDRREILRYAGVRGDAPELENLLDECILEIGDRLSCRVCARNFPISFDGETVSLGFVKTDSRTVLGRLSGCERVIVFAATVGLELDRMIARFGRISPAKALFFQAIGAERIEALCDTFCADVSETLRACGYTATPRFSPGYGDIPLEIQRDIFAALDCTRRIGIVLNESLLMSPSKSVTAFIGIKKDWEKVL